MEQKVFTLDSYEALCQALHLHPPMMDNNCLGRGKGGIKHGSVRQKRTWTWSLVQFLLRFSIYVVGRRTRVKHHLAIPGQYFLFIRFVLGVGNTTSLSTPPFSLPPPFPIVVRQSFRMRKVHVHPSENVMCFLHVQTRKHAWTASGPLIRSNTTR